MAARTKGDVPGRFSARVLPLGPGPVLGGEGFCYVEVRVFGMVMDRATGDAGWTFAPTAGKAHDTLSAWAAERLRQPAPNPYEPKWKDPKSLTDKQRDKQDQVRRIFRKEKRRRGELVEAQKKIERLRDRGALFAVSHSGGKDSQAMAILVSKIVPEFQILWVHAPLRGVEWAGIMDQVERYKPAGVPLVFADALDKHGEQKWLLERVLDRGMWPSKGQRWCTSDFKRGPIRREVRGYADAKGYTIIVDAQGLRAEESGDRANRPAFAEHPDEHGKRSVKLGLRREWYSWLPIKWASTNEVFDVIAQADQQPIWTYQEGMSRASCAFCILASIGDLAVAAQLAPALYAMYVAVEQQIGHTIRTRSREGRVVPFPLEEATGIRADPKLVRNYLKQIETTGELRDIPVAGEAAYRQFKRARGKRAPDLRVLREFGQMEV